MSRVLAAKRRAHMVALALVSLLLCVSTALAAPERPSVMPGKQGGPALLAYGDDDIWDENGNVVKKGGGDQGADIAANTPDPLEGWNRMWFGFNDKMYFWVMKPVAQGYGYALPERPRIWIHNFFHNLLYPVRFTSLMLQGKFDAAGMETSKFIGNTAFGLGGLGDVTSDLKPLRPTASGEQDLGLTFGYWGVENGMYVVWPVLGPSSARDSVGYVGDYFLTPSSYIHPWYWSMSAKGYEKLNEVSLRIGEYETLKEAAIDPYDAVRDAYLRNRYKKMHD